MSLSKLTKEWIAKKLPKRPQDANKGTFGRVLVIAGSENYPGAAYLTCAAAYRVGAGLVTLMTTNDVKVIVSRKLPEVTFLTFSGSLEKIKEYDAIVLGPGLGQKEEMKKFIKELLKEKLPKLIIDGDGLNILSGMGKWWDRVNNETILAPHPGEFSRLTGLTINKIQSDRENIAKKFAKKWETRIVLKGANTIIVSPAGEVVISPFANPLLATAGTGDVLTGIIGGFLAQGLEPFDGSCLAVYIHGLAAEMLKKKFGDRGMLASDLLSMIPIAIRDLV